MSDSKANVGGGGKRSLPSWMSDKDNESDSRGKKPISSGGNEGIVEAEESVQGKGNGEGPTTSSSSKEIKNVESFSAVGSYQQDFSKLLEGVVFVLSGFVNPERSILRSQALEMGAEYQPDWNSACTLLICAFPNTPKFRQVESDCGTIVSKEWISECYARKELIDIESYLMYPGKPWRRINFSHDTSQAKIALPSRKPQMPVERVLHSKPNEQVISQIRDINSSREYFSPLKLKKWAIDDFHKTISWLESQEEKPEPMEIRKIAAEGILTCLQDAIDSLEQNQDINQMTEEWKFIPQVVEELAKLSKKESLSKEELCRQAMDSKKIYEEEFSFLHDNSSERKKKAKTNKEKKKGPEINKEYDSDETIEMTEGEIDFAFQTVSSKKT